MLATRVQSIRNPQVQLAGVFNSAASSSDEESDEGNELAAIDGSEVDSEDDGLLEEESTQEQAASAPTSAPTNQPRPTPRLSEGTLKYGMAVVVRIAADYSDE